MKRPTSLRHGALVLLLQLSALALTGQTYICQPYYNANLIRIYPSISPVAAAPVAEFNISADISAGWTGLSGGPNAVAMYRDKLFVSVDLAGATAGGVLIYNWADVFPTRNANPPTVVKPVLGPKDATTPGLTSAGIAVNPANGDLYIPTFNSSNGDGGIYLATAASNYATVTQFSSFVGDKSVAQICANLAFDKNNNLWMTTWTYSNNIDQHFLICYRGLNKNKFHKIGNGAADRFTAINAPFSMKFNLFSAPEGLAFDAQGNLYIGNNNDGARTNDVGEGTLVKVNAAAIATLLSTDPNPGNVPNFNPAPTTFTSTDAEVLHFANGKLGGMSVQGNYLYINDQGKNEGGDINASGEVSRWDLSKPFSTGLVASDIHTTYPGNGGAAFARPYGIMSRDNPTDDGFEPNTTKEAMWESMDIWVRTANDGKTNDVSQEPTGSRACNVYVRVRNTGFQPTNGTEVVKLYWAKASSSLAWTAPWDGAPIGGKKMGGNIATAQTAPVIQPGQSTVLEFPWTAVDPRSFGGDGHFCLLARIETQATTPFGMNKPEQTGGISDFLINNVRNNSHIAWRNISILPGSGVVIPPSIIMVHNHGDAQIHGKLVFEVFDAQSKPMDLSQGRLFLHAEGKSLDKFQNIDYNRELLQTREDGQFEVMDLQNSFDHLVLEPGEGLEVGVQFVPNQEMKGYVVRTSMQAYLDEGPVLIGGQTLVIGEVDEYNVNTISAEEVVDGPVVDPVPAKTCWLGLPCWVWIVIGAVVVGILVLVVLVRRR